MYPGATVTANTSFVPILAGFGSDNGAANQISAKNANLTNGTDNKPLRMVAAQMRSLNVAQGRAAGCGCRQDLPATSEATAKKHFEKTFSIPSGVLL